MTAVKEHKSKRAKGQKAAPVWSEAEKAAWKLPLSKTVSHWAETKRIVGDYSAEPGPWRTARVPFAKEIMDAYSDPEVEEITITGPAQCSKTESAFNMIGFTLDCDPAPTMWVTARDEDCPNISETRLRPMFEAPGLRNHLTGRPWDMKKGSEFIFDRMSFYFTGANSPSGLASKPIGRLFCDEIDKWKKTVGSEGNPLSLAKRRLSTFKTAGNSKFVKICTPTTEDGEINKSLRRSNNQDRYLPCPHCGEYFLPQFAQLKVDPPDLRDPDAIIAKQAAYYECQNCRGRIEDWQRNDMDLKGKWVPEGQTVDKNGNLHGRAKKSKRHSGFNISWFVNTFVSFYDIMAEWFEACAEGDGSPGVLQEFFNQVLGYVWKQAARVTAFNEIEKRKGDFSQGTVPDDVLILTASADFHKKNDGSKRIDYEVRGFGYSMRNWVISSGSIFGVNDEPWSQLENEIFNSPFPWSNPENKKMPLAVRLLCVDSRFETVEICDFCARWPGLAVPTMGGKDDQRAQVIVSNPDKSVTARRRHPGQVNLYIFNPGYFKDQVTGWANAPAASPGSTLFYAECPEVYFKEFCNEHKVKNKNRYGMTTESWQPITEGAPTHFLDTAVMTAVAAYILQIRFLKRPGEQRTLPEHYRNQGRRAEEQKGIRKKQGGGFLNDMPRL